MTHDALRQGAEGPLSDLLVYGAPWGIDPATIRVPTLVWQGSADIIVPRAVAVSLARQISGCRLIEIDGGGHFWVLDHIDEVLTALADEICRNRPDASNS